VIDDPARATDHPMPSEAVLELYAIDPASVAPLPGGLINLSFSARTGVGGGRDCVLQRVSPIFPPAIHDDIDAVTRHLRAKGIATPELLRTTDGRHHVVVEGAVWRALTRIPGESRESVGSDAEVAEAGRALGRFHAALADFSRPLAGERPPVHAIEQHLEALDRALAAHSGHAALDEAAGVAAGIFALAETLSPLPALPKRLVHGDPKISNVIFEQGRAVCLVDLDTIARFAVPLELGDALRSWCNLAAEDSSEARFSVARFEAALAGYREGAGELLTADEWRAVPGATLSIAVELAARFAADALNESYFAWDARRFESASAHNLARAAAQLELARSIGREMAALAAGVVTEP